MSFEIAVVFAAGAAALTALLCGHGLLLLGFPLPEKAARFGNIDGLRGFLALSVMIHHLRLWTLATSQGEGWGTGTNDPLNNFGAGAVCMFFAITGLLFYNRVLSGLTRTDWIRIYVSRIFRIIPAVTMSVAIIFTIIALRRGINGDIATNFRAIALWISAWSQPPILGDPNAARLNASVFWSLRVEWLFYIFLLPALALVRQITRSFLPSWSVPLFLLLASVLIQIFVPRLAYWPRFGILFAVGMLTYELKDRLSTAFLRGPGIALFAVILLLIAATMQPSPYGFPAILAYALFFVVVTCGNDIFGTLGTRAACVLGEISFSIYILHGIVLDLLFVEIIPHFSVHSSATTLLLVSPVAAILVVSVSAISFLCVEAPGIRAGRAILAHRKQNIGRETRTMTQVAP